MAHVRPGDTLVVTELSRMTRSLLALLETAKVLLTRWNGSRVPSVLRPAAD